MSGRGMRVGVCGGGGQRAVCELSSFRGRALCALAYLPTCPKHSPYAPASPPHAPSRSAQDLHPPVHVAAGLGIRQLLQVRLAGWLGGGGGAWRLPPWVYPDRYIA